MQTPLFPFVEHNFLKHNELWTIREIQTHFHYNQGGILRIWQRTWNICWPTMANTWSFWLKDTFALGLCMQFLKRSVSIFWWLCRGGLCLSLWRLGIYGITRNKEGNTCGQMEHLLRETMYSLTLQDALWLKKGEQTLSLQLRFKNLRSWLRSRRIQRATASCSLKPIRASTLC